MSKIGHSDNISAGSPEACAGVKLKKSLAYGNLCADKGEGHAWQETSIYPLPASTHQLPLLNYAYFSVWLLHNLLTLAIFTE